MRCFINYFIDYNWKITIKYQPKAKAIFAPYLPLTCTPATDFTISNPSENVHFIETKYFKQI